MIKRLFIVFIGFLLFTSCEDVIEVELPTEEPRLIIDALIRVDTSQALTKATVKVSETNSFFESIPPANLQQISLTGLDGGLSAILLEEEPGSGIYSKEIGTSALIGEEIFLQIDFNDEFFVAYAEFVPAVPIDELKNGDGFVFDEDDEEIVITFTDNGDRDDFYLFDFSFGNFLVTEDEFYNGQQFEFSYFYDEEVAPGDEVTVSIMGVDQEFYNYMDQIIEQTEQNFGVFETPAITVRGNIINATEIDNIDNFDNVGMPDNFALGYFAIVQEYKETLVIE